MQMTSSNSKMDIKPATDGNSMKKLRAGADGLWLMDID